MVGGADGWNMNGGIEYIVGIRVLEYRVCSRYSRYWGLKHKLLCSFILRKVG